MPCFSSSFPHPILLRCLLVALGSFFVAWFVRKLEGRFLGFPLEGRCCGFASRNLFALLGAGGWWIPRLARGRCRPNRCRLARPSLLGGRGLVGCRRSIWLSLFWKRKKVELVGGLGLVDSAASAVGVHCQPNFTCCKKKTA